MAAMLTDVRRDGRPACPAGPVQYPGRLRALVVFPFPLYAEGGAAARCGIGLLRGLIESGVETQALVADMRPEVVPGPPADLPVEVVHIEHPSEWPHRFERIVRPYTGLARGAFPERLRARVAEADVVHLVGIEAGALLPLVDRPALAQLDCFTRRDRDLAWPWTQDGRIGIELLRGERRTVRRARWLLASSPEVAAEFASQAPRAEVACAPLPLDPGDYADRAALDEPVAGLIGTARWPPTANAVERLLRTVWPRVVERLPGARLVLAGRGMEPGAFPGLPSDLPGVEWRGSVESATAFLGGLGVLAYPLGRGSGAKIKVLEALALGVPIVTTPEGAEGLGGDGGVAVREDDEALADAVVALLADRDARLRAGDAAHANFAAHHAPRVAAAPVVDLYRRMLERAPARPLAGQLG